MNKLNGYPKKEILFWICIVAVFALMFMSCSTLNKHKSSSTTTTTSTTHATQSKDSVVKVDSGRLVKDNTITTTRRDDSSTTTTIIEFDSTASDTATLDAIFNRGGTPASDYFPFIPQKIKRITTRTTLVTHASTATQANKVDSSHAAIQSTTHQEQAKDSTGSAKAVVKDKDVKRSSWAWLWWLLLIPAVYLAYHWIDKHKKKIDDLAKNI